MSQQQLARSLVEEHHARIIASWRDGELASLLSHLEFGDFGVSFFPSLPSSLPISSLTFFCGMFAEGEFLFLLSPFLLSFVVKLIKLENSLLAR